MCTRHVSSALRNESRNRSVVKAEVVILKMVMRHTVDIPTGEFELN